MHVRGLPEGEEQERMKTSHGYLSRLERVESELALLREEMSRLHELGSRLESQVERLNGNIVTHILSGSVWTRVHPDGPNAAPFPEVKKL